MPSMRLQPTNPRPLNKVENLEFSTRDIPTPSTELYKKALIRQVESLIDRMRWKYIFALKKDEEYDPDKTLTLCDSEDEASVEMSPASLGLKTFKKPGKTTSTHLNNFESDVIAAISSIKSRSLPPKQEKFDKEIKKSIKEACPPGQVMVFGDKSTNKYNLGVKEWREIISQLLKSNYKKVNLDRLITLNQNELATAEALNLDEFLPPILVSRAYFTIKDHKEDFERMIPNEHCRLINPTKSHLGKVVNFRVKHILSQIKPKNPLRTVFTNTQDAINWLRNIKQNVEDRGETRLGTTIDITNYYPNIKFSLIEQALSWAGLSATFPADTLSIIKQASIGLLFDGEQLWERIGEFEITQGGYHSASLADLTSAYINFKLDEEISKESSFDRFQWGLYKDDIVMHWEGRSMRTRENFVKKVCSVIKGLGFNVKTSLWQVKAEFLDISMDFTYLENDAYMKPNNTLLYVNANSNHHPKILKNLPSNIIGRVINITSRDEKIKEAIAPYQKALKESNYTKIEEVTGKLLAIRDSGQGVSTAGVRKKAKRPIIWFTPPFNGLYHGIGLTDLINKHFIHGIKDNNGILTRRLFNPRTVRASASNAPNLERIIKANNARNLKIPGKKEPNWEVFSSEEAKAADCSCRGDCPLGGNCHRKNCIYLATITTKDSTKPSDPPTTVHYIGSTVDFKERHAQHTHTMKSTANTSSTLSSFIHGLKDCEESTVKWSILEEDLQTFNGKYCDLCDSEKYHLIHSKKNLINKRSEIANKCKHRTTGPFHLPNWEMGKIAAIRDKDRLRMRRGRLKKAALMKERKS